MKNIDTMTSSWLAEQWTEWLANAWATFLALSYWVCAIGIALCMLYFFVSHDKAGKNWAIRLFLVYLLTKIIGAVT